MRKYDPQTDTVMTRDQVRSVDAWAINDMGIAGTILMENAGRSCAEYILSVYGRGVRPAIFCGAGNNGGDGYVIARHLANAGSDVLVVLCADEKKIKGDARINLDIIRKMNIKIQPLDPASPSMPDLVRSFVVRADVLVDGLFGTGLSGTLKPEYASLVDVLNAAGRPVIAVDIPSGLDCNTGQPLGTAIRALATVTFVAPKPGFKNLAARAYTGDIYIASIGIEPDILLNKKGQV